MVIWILIIVLATIFYALSQTTIQSGGVANYPFNGNGPYVWPTLWFERQRRAGTIPHPYLWPPSDQQGFPIRWIGNKYLPLPNPFN